jgi:lysophospholipase L1-like esterase
MRYLLFGASTTFGEIDPEFGGWAGHLRKYLDMKENHCFFSNLAISGNTSEDLLRRIESEAKARIRRKPKEDWTMFLSIGTNDSRIENDNPKVTEEEYEKNFQEILKISKELVGRVVVIGIYPVKEEICNPFKGFLLFLNERIKNYEQIMRECCKKQEIEYIDIYSDFEKLDESYYADGLHPNSKGHKVIFEKVKNYLENSSK